MPRCEKFSEKFDLAFSSQNCSRDGVGSEGEEEEDALKRRGFRDRMDLRLGAMMQLMYERGRKTIKKAPNIFNIKR